MAEFKDRVKALREEKDITQDQLAERLGVTKMAISGYENGKRKPRFDMLDNLADVLDVDINYLTGASDVRKPYPRMTEEEKDRIGADLVNVDISVEELDLVNAYRRLDECAKKIIRLTAHLDE